MEARDRVALRTHELGLGSVVGACLELCADPLEQRALLHPEQSPVAERAHGRHDTEPRIERAPARGGLLCARGERAGVFQPVGTLPARGWAAPPRGAGGMRMGKRHADALGGIARRPRARDALLDELGLAHAFHTRRVQPALRLGLGKPPEAGRLAQQRLAPVRIALGKGPNRHTTTPHSQAVTTGPRTPHAEDQRSALTPPCCRGRPSRGP